MHHASWEAFARKLGWHVHASELVLVYGCVKTSSWALAAYASRENEHELGFSLNAGSFVSAHAGADAREHVQMSMEQRSGPQRPPDADLSTPAPKDQCLFISYYKIKRRGMGAVKLQGHAALEDMPVASDSEYFCMPWTCFPLDILHKYRCKRKKPIAGPSVGLAVLDVEELEARKIVCSVPSLRKIYTHVIRLLTLSMPSWITSWRYVIYSSPLFIALTEYG